ncbi:MAG: UDP-N-acetylmuramate dehydrogenase [Arcanobacterium sp.]|nr:UDP-N-acetylmuramate dehydrogenase [Arcanobacterium sp.]
MAQIQVQANRIKENPKSFADLTTIAVGGTFEQLIEVNSEEEFVTAIKTADDAQQPLLVLGGGSNLLAADTHFPGVVIRDLRKEITTSDVSSCGGALVKATAGTPWDELVAYAVENEWMGIEALSGIPGSVGAAPIQNIGAYGQDVSGVITQVRTFDRKTQKIRTFFLHDLKLGYRHSILKETINLPEFGPTPRWIVLEVSFQMRTASLSEPVRYGQLAAHLGVEIGERAPAIDVRNAVIELRASKGMVLDDADRDTYSLGSFFTNPVLTLEQAEALPEEAPKFGVEQRSKINQIGAAAPTVAGQVKTSASWLIENAGFAPGYQISPEAGLSTKHALAITNRGGANSAQIRELAQEIIDGVESRFGVTLLPEPVFM